MMLAIKLEIKNYFSTSRGNLLAVETFTQHSSNVYFDARSKPSQLFKTMSSLVSQSGKSLPFWVNIPKTSVSPSSFLSNHKIVRARQSTPKICRRNNNTSSSFAAPVTQTPFYSQLVFGCESRAKKLLYCRKYFRVVQLLQGPLASFD